MNEVNPYQSPEATAPATSPDGDAPTISTTDTIVPRHIAAIIDSIVALVLGVMAAKAVAEDAPLIQSLVFVATYLGYFLLCEGFLARTPGKLLTGLVIVQYDGRRCTWGQTLIRTGFRLLEVNPLLLGAIPAALSIIFSKRHQRFGDRTAGTIVVPARRLRKRR